LSRTKEKQMGLTYDQALAELSQKSPLGKC
jgi:hypothetical protein